nr:unnamed protein product [Spirometra erinaceieuropaei]
MDDDWAPAISCPTKSVDEVTEMGVLHTKTTTSLIRATNGPGRNLDTLQVIRAWRNAAFGPRRSNRRNCVVETKDCISEGGRNIRGIGNRARNDEVVSVVSGNDDDVDDDDDDEDCGGVGDDGGGGGGAAAAANAAAGGARGCDGS